MAEKTVEFTFQRPWTHAKKKYGVGDKDKFTEADVRWLKERGADKPIQAQEAPPPAPATVRG